MNKKQHVRHEIVLVGPCEVSLQDQRIMYANRLHVECNAINNRIAELGNKMWQNAFVLGCVLDGIRRGCPLGEWGKMFADRKNPNSAHVRNFGFSQDSANRYIKLSREVKKKSIKMLGKDNALSGDITNLTPSVSECLSQLCDASSLREAFYEFGVMSPPKERGANLENGDRNEKGRPKKTGGDVAPSPEAVEDALELERADAEAMAVKINADVIDFLRMNFQTIVSPDALKKLKGTFQSAVDSINLVSRS